ncbi:lysosomal membrane ascorbate-dependent ferrireductase CYB561A3 isoform X1 [Monodelphis domestica]|uniref:Lysosomal membrane ascorbate-dependent ferrireductase CYB561A3 n=2 Tax=Monodelphis domestica TaxID=13616 RepID=F7FK22_MONDO|nr:lysosomal membrane ascorbate-dependent ferrireductase CYB561A3 isoform X1 [Monodelphis domestica]
MNEWRPLEQAGAGHAVPFRPRRRAEFAAGRASRSPGGGGPGPRRPRSGMALGRFYLFSLVLGTLGSLCVLFTIYWAQHWRGGFRWDGSSRMFNWHPVLMVAGMVVLYGAASLVYRLPQAWLGPKLPWKLLHAALHLAAFVLAVLGLVAVFDFHRHNHIAHLYSLHSWLGIAAVALFACQWFLGFAIFLLPWASLWLRSVLKPLHVFLGATILSLSTASVISGINEKLFFSLKNATAPYSSLPPEARFANSTGMLVVIFGVLVLYVLLASSWKRPEPGLLSDRQPLLQEGE